jgi:hypothetical protein
MFIIAILAIGFSLGAALLLVVGNVLQQQPQRCLAKAAGFLLILELASLQILHLSFFLTAFDVFHATCYILLLYPVVIYDCAEFLFLQSAIARC